MSNTMRTMSFSLIVRDYEHWTPEQIEAADRCPDCSTYDDHALHLVEDFMRKAGNAALRNDRRKEMYLSEEVS